jgi:hypothetical protein
VRFLKIISCLCCTVLLLGCFYALSFGRQKFPCLPKGIKGDAACEFDYRGTKVRKITVDEKLTEMQARCEKGKLVDAAGKEIRFYVVHVFGAPTDYAIKTMQRERKEIEALKKTYTVIELPADQSGEPRP